MKQERTAVSKVKCIKKGVTHDGSLIAWPLMKSCRTLPSPSPISSQPYKPAGRKGKKKHQEFFLELTIRQPIKSHVNHALQELWTDERKREKVTWGCHTYIALPQRNARSVVGHQGGKGPPAQQLKNISRVPDQKSGKKDKEPKKGQQPTHTVLFCLFAWLTPCQGLAGSVFEFPALRVGTFLSSAPPLFQGKHSQGRRRGWGWSFLCLALSTIFVSPFFLTPSLHNVHVRGHCLLPLRLASLS